MDFKKIAIPLLVINVGYGLASENPNIVFILADDMGYGDISALNEQAKIHTPFLDKMCRNGITFTDAHSNSSVSTPTRYGILTGRYSFRSTLKRGVLNGTSNHLIPKERATLASMLSKQGYQTACIGKWHLGWDWTMDENGQIDFTKPIKNGPSENGFDYYYSLSASLDFPPYVYVENDKATAIPTRKIEAGTGKGFWRPGLIAPDFKHEECLENITMRACSYIESKKESEQPFFLYFPITAPHTPILPSEKFRGKSGLNEYADFVLMVDDVVGRIVKSLEDSGKAENTIIIFTSDNGCSPTADLNSLHQLGHYPNYIFRGMKSDLYDGGHRIPLIIQWGNRYNNIKSEQLVCLTDFFATFASITDYNVKDNEAEDSFSFHSILQREVDSENMRKMIIHHSVDGSFSIREKEWKLLLSPHSGGWSYPNLKKDKASIPSLPLRQLYNMEEDKTEKMNVADQHPQNVRRLTRELLQIIENGRSTPGVKQRNEDQDNWPQLKEIYLKTDDKQ